MLNNQLISAYRAAQGFTEFFPWQLEVIEKLRACKPLRPNLIYSAPTSSGKSIVADTLVWQSLLDYKAAARAGNLRALVVYMLPYVALVREKTHSLKKVGDYLDLTVHPYFFGAPKAANDDLVDIAVCTIEKAAQLLQKIITDQSRYLMTVVIDEFHMFYTENRGDLIENLIIKIKCLRQGGAVKERLDQPEAALGIVEVGGGVFDEQAVNFDSCQIIGMSATFPNRERLALWLQAIDYESLYRPVILKEFVVLHRKSIYSRDAEGGGGVKPCAEGYRVACDYVDAKAAIPDSCEEQLELEELCLDPVVYRNHSVLLFCHSRKACESQTVRLAQRISQLREPLVVPKNIATARQRALLLLRNLALSSWGSGRAKLWQQSIPFGVGVHHSGLSNEEKEIIEESYRNGVLKLLVATSTLAAGVNLPACRVVFDRPFLGSQFMTPMDYKQMCGRAGRKGQGDYGESFLICHSTEELKKVTENLVLGRMSGRRIRTKDAWARLISESCALAKESGVDEIDLLRLAELNIESSDGDRSELEICKLTIEALLRLGHISKKGDRLIAGELAHGCVDVSPYAGYLIFEEFARLSWISDCPILMLYTILPTETSTSIGSFQKHLDRLCGRIWENCDSYIIRSAVNSTLPPCRITERYLGAFEWLINICCLESKTRWALSRIGLDLDLIVGQLRSIFLSKFEHWLSPSFLNDLIQAAQNHHGLKVCASGLRYGCHDLINFPGYKVVRMERLYQACILDYYLNARGPLNLLLDRINYLPGDLESLAQTALCNGSYIVKLAEKLRWFNLSIALDSFIQSQTEDRRLVKLHKMLPILDRHTVKLMYKGGYTRLDEICRADPSLLAHVFLNCCSNHIFWRKFGQAILPETLKTDCSAPNPNVTPSVPHTEASMNPYELARAIAQQIIIMACVSRRGWRAWRKKDKHQYNQNDTEESINLFSMSIRHKLVYIWTQGCRRRDSYESSQQTDHSMPLETPTNSEAENPYPTDRFTSTIEPSSVNLSTFELPLTTPRTRSPVVSGLLTNTQMTNTNSADYDDELNVIFAETPSFNSTPQQLHRTGLSQQDLLSDLDDILDAPLDAVIPNRTLRKTSLEFSSAEVLELDNCSASRLSLNHISFDDLDFDSAVKDESVLHSSLSSANQAPNRSSHLSELLRSFCSDEIDTSLNNIPSLDLLGEDIGARTKRPRLSIDLAIGDNPKRSRHFRQKSDDSLSDINDLFLQSPSMLLEPQSPGSDATIIL